MTEQLTPREITPDKQPKKRNNKLKIAVTGLGIAVAGTGAFAVAGAFRGTEKTNADGGYPSTAPSAMATPEATPTVKPTGTPEATPMATPEATPAPSAENIQNIDVEQLTPFEVQTGDFISADVSMSDTNGGTLFPLMDTDYDYLNSAVKVDITRTAMGVDVEAPGWVVAPYGKITVIRGMSPEKKAAFIANEIALKQRGGQFDAYNVVVWKGLNDTVDQAGYKFDKTFVGSTTTSENSTGSTAPTAESMANLTAQEKLNLIVRFFIDNKIDPTKPDSKELLDMMAACLCGCSTPTESPMPTKTPAPTTMPEAVCKPMTDIVIDAGTVWHTNGEDFIIEGAVTIDGKKGFTPGNDSSKIKQIDWVSDGKKHTVVFNYRSDRQLFASCATNQNEKDTYNSDKVADNRKLDPKSIIIN